MEDFRSVSFGFREVWREGKEIMMNGHKAHFRPVYGFGSKSKPSLSFLQSIGYNVVFRGHSREAIGVTGEEGYSNLDEMGMGVYPNVGAYDIIGADLLNKDPAMREEFRRFVRVFHRQVRNHPSIMAGILGTMSKTSQGFSPGSIGRAREPASDRGEQIELAREIHREANPNILYFSHADGPWGDIDNGNVYLNWISAHEQESWLEKWSVDGEFPWSSIEFLSPYPGDFVKSSVFLGTEYLAGVFGDRAYREETDDFIGGIVEADKVARGHGSAVGNEMLRSWPLYWELRRDWTWRFNSRWRAFGLNGGNMWFNLAEGYGNPPEWDGKAHLGRYGAITNMISGRPAWANEGYDVHRLGNQDFCGFIGGAPDLASRTHAYYAGEKIEKQLVMIWDGAGEKAVKAEWKVFSHKDRKENVELWNCEDEGTGNGEQGTGNGEQGMGNGEQGRENCHKSQLSTNDTNVNLNSPTHPLTHSQLSTRSTCSTWFISQGEQARVPISFVAPDVKEKTSYRLAATFTGEGIEPFTDTFDFEVWPNSPTHPLTHSQLSTLSTCSTRLNISLLDPLGEGAGVLDALGVKYRKIEKVADLPADATHLVIGRDALTEISIDALAPRIEEGLRVFIMRQTPDTWRKMGFRVQDLMLREVFARDAAFKNLPEDALRYWRGTPDYPNAPYGRVMSHATQRGPRGTRRHVVAGLVLQVPERVGYVPMIVGGFDLNYAALLRFEVAARAVLAPYREKGDITYCTLDFEGRVGIDPGATETAKAVFGEFLGNVKLWNCGNMEICKYENGERGTGNGKLFTNRDCHNCSQITNANTNSPTHPLTHSQLSTRSTCSTRLDKNLQDSKTPSNESNHNPVNPVNPVENFELVVCDSARAIAEGFAVGAETNILRAAIPDCAAFRGVGLGDVRWPSGLAIKPLRGEGATPDGAFAVKRAGGKTLVFSQIPEGQLAARAAKRDEKKEKALANAERFDEGRVRRMYARLRTNGGNDGKSLRRALHKSGGAEYETLPAMHLLGPFSAGKDSSKLMLDTVWSEKGEAMAIKGDFDPNHEFHLPQGGTANWRPMLAPNAEGVFDFTTAQPITSFPVTYAICHVERKAAGDAILKLGGDWRFAVWCNGEQVFRTESGARIPRFEVKVPLKAGDNVLAFKVGAGSGGHRLIALLSSERGNGAGEDRDEELDSMTLYEDDVMGFDPYEFHYW